MAGASHSWLKAACISLIYLVFLGSASVFAGGGSRPAGAPASDQPQQAAILWQGFDHEWRRFVLLPREGRVPHRISRLASYTRTDTDSDQNISGSFHFAQSTGVDGNYMWPEGYWSALHSSRVEILSQSLALQWTDTISSDAGDEAPFAVSDKTTMISLSVPHGFRAAAVLNGIDLAVSCDNSKQPAELPCNSDGLWPYEFFIGFDQCLTTGNNGSGQIQTLECPLHIRLHRGWTPNKGGLQIPPFFNEVKPLNQRLDIQLTVHYSLLQAPLSEFNVVYPESFTHTQTLQNPESYQNEFTMAWQNSFVNSRLMSGITGFGFQLHEPLYIQDIWTLLGSDTRRRGRYIARLRFHSDNPRRNQDHSLLTLPYSTHVWSPITVVDSLVTTRLDTAILEFSENTATGEQHKTRGRLCINSTDQAPAFSRWQNCNLNYWWARWIYSKEQAEDAVIISDVFHHLSEQ